MRRDLDILLDECIDRINDGESLEDCLASYPEQAEELEPRLRAMFDIRDTLSTIPGATAKAAMRQRLDAAQVSLEKRHRKSQWSPSSLFGRPGVFAPAAVAQVFSRRRVFAPVAIALVLALVGFGLYGAFSPGLTPTVVAQDNFRLLLSDDVSNTTAIADFESVWVTVLGIGLRQSGGPEVLINSTDIDHEDYNLKDYLGPDAVTIWEGSLEPGDYKGVVLYLADDVSGKLTQEAGGDEVNIKIPSDKLKLDIPFTVVECGTTECETSIDYVFDITVVKAGNSGQYILQPVVKESGPDQKYVLHGAKADDAIAEEAIEFEDTISDIGPPLVIGDYTVTVDDNTVIAGVKGELVKGLTVTVEGVLRDENLVLASKIKIDRRK